MIGGVIKYFRFDWDDVLWNRSYANVNMLLASIPHYEPIDEKDKEDKNDDEVIDSFDDYQSFFKE